MNEVELALHRRNTKAFIDWDPVEITLIPVTRTRTAGGGTRESDDAPRWPQTFRLLPQSGSSTPPVATTRDGRQREADYVLLGEFDAEMAIGDHWEAEDGRQWRVRDIVRSNHYETRGLVTERGQ